MFERAFCPVFLAACVLVTWLARRNGVDWAQTLFFSSAGPMLVLTIVEHLRPYREDWNYGFRAAPRKAARELAKDLLYMLVITRIHSWILPTIFLHTVPLARIAGKKLHVYGLISSMPMPVRIAVVLLVGEFFWYWGHRLQHEVPWMWRFHAAHHAPTKLNALKSSRNHPLDMLFLSVIGYLPLVMLGAKAKDIMWAALIQSVVNVLSHANVPAWGGIFTWVFSAPDVHRCHHSADEERSKSNYGCRLLVWDRLFGTFRAAPTDEGEIVVGVARDGVVRETTLREELVDPFMPPLGGLARAPRS
jgi:sterol desaturase/sphingolipid hydroxylase (fatty acid hydroxylase superfamily)